MLSDQKVEDGATKEDYVKLSSEKIYPIVSREYAKSKAALQKKESEQKLNNITSSNEKIKDSDTATEEDKAAAESSSLIVTDIAGLQGELDALLANVNSATAEIMAKIEQINELLRKASAIADKLSSGVFAALDSIEEMIGNTSRPEDVSAISQYRCLIPDTIAKNSSYSSYDGSEFFITITTHIAKAHSIKQRIPEILKISIDGKEYNSDNYKDITIGSNPIVINVSGKKVCFQRNGTASIIRNTLPMNLTIVPRISLKI